MNGDRLHVSVCGHVKNGKSTLAGRLASELSRYTKRQLLEFERLASERGPDFNKYSVIFLQRQPPAFKRRSKNDRIDPSRTTVPSVVGDLAIEDLAITIIDVPGHEDFLDSIVYGAYLADGAIVVADVGEGASLGTQTTLRILSSFKVPILACCVSKMDLLDFSQKAFEKVEEKLRGQLEDVLGESGAKVPILPISALSEGGEGVCDRTSATDPRFNWYLGPNLLETLKGGHDLANPQLQDVRFLVEGDSEIFSVQGPGTVMLGTLEYGRLQRAMELVVEPASTLSGKDVIAKVKSIRRPGAPGSSRTLENIKAAAAREILSVGFQGYKYDQARRDFKHGGVIGSRGTPPVVAKRMRARIYFFEADHVYGGKEFKIHPHGSWSMARVREISERSAAMPLQWQRTVNKKGRERAETVVPGGEEVVGVLELQRPLCIEEVHRFPRLARFVVRDANRVVACGYCEEVLDQWPREKANRRFPWDAPPLAEVEA